MAAVHKELILSGVFNEAGVDELAHHVGGKLASLCILGQLHHLPLKGVDLSLLGLLLGLLLGCGLLVGLDLCLGAAPLRADLQHVGRHALGDYEGTEESIKTWDQSTYG